MRYLLAGTLLMAGIMAPTALAQQGIPGNGTSLVAGWYKHFLNREPDASAARWVEALQNGQQPESVLAQLLASPEYYAKGGNTREGFVQTIYRDVIGRPPTRGELDFWLPRLAYTSRGDMAYALITYTGPTWQTPSPGYYGPRDQGYTPAPDYNYRRPSYLYGR